MDTGAGLDLARLVAGWCLITGPVLHIAYRAWRLWASVPDAPSARQWHRLARLGEPDWDDRRWAYEIRQVEARWYLVALCLLAGWLLVS